MISRLALFSILLALVFPALAQDENPEPPPEFDVELIVFRHLSPDDTEQPVTKRDYEFDDDNGNEFGDKAGDADDAADEKPEIEIRRFPPLATDQLRLGSVSDKLLDSRDWSPILHYGWRQPVLGRDDGPAVAIAGNRRGAYATGTVRLTVERFLRLELDLKMDPGTGIAYTLNQARRLRSGQMHYFDHPQFGLVVLVSRTD